MTKYVIRDSQGVFPVEEEASASSDIPADSIPPAEETLDKTDVQKPKLEQKQAPKGLPFETLKKK